MAKKKAGAKTEQVYIIVDPLRADSSVFYVKCNKMADIATICTRIRDTYSNAAWMVFKGEPMQVSTIPVTVMVKDGAKTVSQQQMVSTSVPCDELDDATYDFNPDYDGDD